MRLYDTETCCTALELGDFDRDYFSFKSFKKEIRSAIKRFDEHAEEEADFDGEAPWLVETRGIIVAYTNDRCDEVNEYLPKLGFTSSPFLKKTKHPETTVAIHWIPVSVLLKNL